MARPRDPKSKLPKYGLDGLTDKEIEYVDKYLDRKGVSFNFFKSFLVRQWMAGKDLSKVEL